MEQNFQDRLKNFQATPPDNVWSKIDHVLESQNEKGFANKLFHFELMPPHYIWQKLSFKIGNGEKNSFTKRPYKKYLVYSSIAASIILSIVTINLITGNKTPATEESLLTGTKILKPSSSAPSPKQNVLDLVDSSGLISAIHTTPKKYNLFSHKVILKNIEERLVQSASSLEQFLPESASRNQEISYEDGMDKYMIYAGDDGNAVRLPKKMYDNFACPSNDPSCREKIKLLQQKVALGSFASDFTGIIDMLTNMDDHK